MSSPRPSRLVEDGLAVLSAYRALVATDALRTSNVASLPQDVRKLERGGSGPHVRLVLFGDSKGVQAHSSRTDADPSLISTIYGGSKAFVITTASRGAPLSEAQAPSFRSVSLSFSAYHSLFAALQELVAVHELPLEWAACWVLMNRHRIPCFDCYVSFASRDFPLRPMTAEAALIALEGHNLGAYLPREPLRLLDTRGDVFIGSSSTQGVPSRSPGLAQQGSDAIPIPTAFIRRASKPDAKGDPRYCACAGAERCEVAIRLYHLRAKDAADPKMVDLDAANALRLVEGLLKTHILLPLPYLRISEAHRACELVDEALYTTSPSGQVAAFAPLGHP
jgi:hypothetical protein